MTPADIHPLTIPKLGMTMKEGSIAAWRVSVGAEVRAGEPVAEIETEKITSTYEAPATGIVRRRLAPEGEVMPVGALIGVIASPGVPDAAIEAFVAAFKPDGAA